MKILRFVFLALVDGHPRIFRNRFREEFLDIFEESGEPRAQSRLVADAFVSLARQWIRVLAGSQRVDVLSPVYGGAVYTDLSAGPGMSRLAQALLILSVTGVIWSLLSHPVRLTRPFAQAVITVTIR